MIIGVILDSPIQATYINKFLDFPTIFIFFKFYIFYEVFCFLTQTTYKRLGYLWSTILSYSNIMWRLDGLLNTVLSCSKIIWRCGFLQNTVSSCFKISRTKGSCEQLVHVKSTVRLWCKPGLPPTRPHGFQWLYCCSSQGGSVFTQKFLVSVQYLFPSRSLPYVVSLDK